MSPMTHATTTQASNRSENPEGKRKRGPCLLKWLMLASLLHGLTYLLLLPPWMGEDEPWHVEYAHYIGRGYLPWGGRPISAADLELYSPSQAQVVREIGGIPREEILSTQEALVGSMRTHDFWRRVDWAGNGDAALNFDQVSPYLTATHQPPLYYLIVGQILRFSGGDVLVEMWLLRGFSLLAYLAVVLASYELGRTLTRDKWLPLIAAVFVAWWPMHARQAAVVNNDVLVKVFSSWSLVLSARIAVRGLSLRRFCIGLMLALGALLTKTTGAAALVPFGLSCVLSPTLREGLLGRRRWLAPLVLLSILAAIPLLYSASNNPAIPRNTARLVERVSAVFAGGFFDEFARTSVGAFNWYIRDLPSVVHSLVALFAGLSAALLLVGLLRRTGAEQPEFRRRVVLICAAGLLSQITLILLRGVSAGRYAMPMIAALAVLCAAAWTRPFSEDRRRIGAGILVLALVLFDGVFLWSGLVLNQYGVWGS